MDNIERRTIDAQIRAESREDDTFTAAGTAVTFNDPYDLGPFDEQIDARAFDGQLDNPQIRAFWSHDSSNVLGRVPDSLRLSADKQALNVEIDFPRSAAREREAVERGDVDKMSFGFRVVEDEWEEDEETGRELRTILDAELFEVSPVAFPANPNTDLGVAQRSRDEWQERKEPAGPDPDVEKRRRERELQLRKRSA